MSTGLERSSRIKVEALIDTHGKDAYLMSDEVITTLKVRLVKITAAGIFLNHGTASICFLVTFENTRDWKPSVIFFCVKYRYSRQTRSLHLTLASCVCVK
jgi:hypothetical protein